MVLKICIRYHSIYDSPEIRDRKLQASGVWDGAAESEPNSLYTLYSFLDIRQISMHACYLSLNQYTDRQIM